MNDVNRPAKASPPAPIHVERWGWYSIAVNVALIAINWVIGAASGSLAVEAELIHNVVDMLTAIGVLIGLKIATRKSHAFPYGLYKVENVVSVILAGMTFVTAYEIAHDALFSPISMATVNAWMLVGVIVAAALPLTFSIFELRAGRAANSPALIADAREYRAHVFTTGVVLAALIGQWLHVPIDRVAALVIVVAIGKTGWELLADGMRVLLDASLDADTLLQVRQIIEAEPAIAEIKWLTGRNAGRFRFVEAEVTLRVHELDKAEVILRRVEGRIRDAVLHIDRVLIHGEPVQRTHWLYAVPLTDTTGTISEHFGEAPYFALVRVRAADGVVDSQQIVANVYLEEEKAKGIRVAEWLVGQKVDVVLMEESLQGRGPVYVFSDAGVEMRATHAKTLNVAIQDQYKNDKEQAH